MAEMSRRFVEAGLEWRWRPATISRYIEHADCETVVATMGRRLVGFAIMHFDDDQAHLLLLAVEPSARRRGVGSAILAWLEVMVRTAGIFDIRLEVRARNGGGRAFYRARGYNEGPSLPGYYQRLEPAVRLQKDLRVIGALPKSDEGRRLE